MSQWVDTTPCCNANLYRQEHSLFGNVKKIYWYWLLESYCRLHMSVNTSETHQMCFLKVPICRNVGPGHMGGGGVTTGMLLGSSSVWVLGTSFSAFLVYVLWPGVPRPGSGYLCPWAWLWLQPTRIALVWLHRRPCLHTHTQNDILTVNFCKTFNTEDIPLVLCTI